MKRQQRTKPFRPDPGPLLPNLKINSANSPLLSRAKVKSLDWFKPRVSKVGPRPNTKSSQLSFFKPKRQNHFDWKSINRCKRDFKARSRELILKTGSDKDANSKRWNSKGDFQKRRQSGSAFRSFQRRRKENKFMSLGGGGKAMQRKRKTGKAGKKRKTKAKFHGKSLHSQYSMDHNQFKRKSSFSRPIAGSINPNPSSKSKGQHSPIILKNIQFPGKLRPRHARNRPSARLKVDVKNFEDLQSFLQCTRVQGIRENVIQRMRRTKCKTMAYTSRNKENQDKTNRQRMVNANVERIKTFFRSQSPVGRKLLTLNPSLALKLNKKTSQGSKDAFFNVLDKHSKHYILVRKGEILDEMPEFISFLRVYAIQSIPILVGICRLIATSRLLFKKCPESNAKIESFRIRVGDILKLAQTVKPQKRYLKAIKNFRKDRDYEVLLELCKGNDFSEFHCTKLLSICKHIKSTNQEVNEERAKIRFLDEFKIRAANLIKNAILRYRDTRLFRLSLKHKKEILRIKLFLRRISTRMYVKRVQARRREGKLLTFLKINQTRQRMGQSPPNSKNQSQHSLKNQEASLVNEYSSFEDHSRLVQNLISMNSNEQSQDTIKEIQIGANSKSALYTPNPSPVSQISQAITSSNHSPSSTDQHSLSIYNNNPLNPSITEPLRSSSRLPIEIHFLDDPLNAYEDLLADSKTAKSYQTDLILLQKSTDHVSLNRAIQAAKNGAISTQLQLGRLFRILHSSKRIVFVTRERVSEAVINYFYSLIDGVLPAECSITSNLYFYNVDCELDRNIFKGVRSLSQRMLLDVKSVRRLSTYISNLGASRDTRIVNSHLSEALLQLSIALRLPLASLCAVHDPLFKELYRVKSKFRIPMIQVFSLNHARRLKMPKAETAESSGAGEGSTLSEVCTKRANEIHQHRTILHEGQKTRKNALKIQIRNQELQFMNRNLETEVTYEADKKNRFQKKLKPDLLTEMFKNPSAVRRFKTEFLKSRERHRKNNLGLKTMHSRRDRIERRIIDSFKIKMEKKISKKRVGFETENLYLSEVKFNSRKKMFKYLGQLLNVRELTYLQEGYS